MNPGTVLFRGLRWAAIRSRWRLITVAKFSWGVSLGQRRLACQISRNLRARASLQVSGRCPGFSLSRRAVVNAPPAAGRLRNVRLPSSARFARRYGRVCFGPLVSGLSGSPAVCRAGNDSWSTRMIERYGRRAPTSSARRLAWIRLLARPSNPPRFTMPRGRHRSRGISHFRSIRIWPLGTSRVRHARRSRRPLRVERQCAPLAHLPAEPGGRSGHASQRAIRRWSVRAEIPGT